MVNEVKSSSAIRVGIGGGNFPPRRGGFFPAKLAQAKELAYAAPKLPAIEINSTYYGSQKPESFRKWARETPDGFKFSVKGPRFTTNRRLLSEAGESIQYFLKTGVTQLGDRLGPLLWQFAPFKKFDEADFRAFLALLPEKHDGRKLRHVIEVRHDSFRVPAFVALLREFNAAVVCAEHETYPRIADITSDFVYLRLQQGKDTIKTGYPPKELDAWAERLKTFATGGVPKDLEQVDSKSQPKAAPRHVFAYVIHEGKVGAAAAAMELIERVT